MRGFIAPTRLTGFAAVLLLMPIPAMAHLASSGLGPVYDGIYHFALSPDEILGVAALALLAGLRGATYSRRVLFTLPSAWLAGSMLDLMPPSAGAQAILTAISLLSIGGALAASMRLPLGIMTLAAAALGLWHGAVDGASFAAEGPRFLPVIGGSISVFVLVALLASVALPLRQFWAITVVRVAGSWVAALGLLLVGWAVHASR